MAFCVILSNEAVAKTDLHSATSSSVGLTAQMGANSGKLGVTISGSLANGQGPGNGTSYTNTQIQGEQIRLKSGADTQLQA